MAKALEQLEKEYRQALHNANRQRAREEMGKPIRVSANFWEQVARDVTRQIERQYSDKAIARAMQEHSR